MNARIGAGFTLLELTIVTAIVAVLGAVALPSYATYVTRSRILDGLARLADGRAKMEQFFLDQRTYVDDSGACGVAPPVDGAADAFSVQCTGTASTFTYTASGVAAKGMASFVYSIDQVGSKTTLSLPPGWSRTPGCWTIRRDGLCV